MDGFTPIRGKCYYFRQKLADEDRYNQRIKRSEWRVDCTCFVEGNAWQYTMDTIPADCPLALHCRYYIKAG